MAILKDYDNEWDGELDSWHGPLARSSAAAWYKALQYRHIPADVVYLRERYQRADLRAYRVLVYPHPAIIDDSTAALLAELCARGRARWSSVAAPAIRTARATARCGRLPGPLADFCGVEVVDFTLIGPRGPAPAIAWAKG